MTCILGLCEDGKVYIGADSASVAGLEVRETKLPKVFQVGRFIIGYTDSFRMGQILRHHLEVRPQGEESDMEYMVRAFAETVRKALKEHGYAHVEHNEEKGGTFLVGYKGHLYSMESDFQVNEMADGMDACGCGRYYALGALRAVTEGTPSERLSLAMKVASYFSGGVRPPFKIESIGD